MFHVGQRVECIGSINMADVMYKEATPLKGAIYMVRGIDACHSDGYVGLWLEEIFNEKRRYANGFQECSFDQRGFRPIIERKTDISIFIALLNPSPQKVRESIG